LMKGIFFFLTATILVPVDTGLLPGLGFLPYLRTSTFMAPELPGALVLESLNKIGRGLIYAKLMHDFSHRDESDVTSIKTPFEFIIVFQVNMKRHSLIIQCRHSPSSRLSSICLRHRVAPFTPGLCHLVDSLVVYATAFRSRLSLIPAHRFTVYSCTYTRINIGIYMSIYIYINIQVCIIYIYTCM